MKKYILLIFIFFISIVISCKTYHYYHFRNELRNELRHVRNLNFYYTSFLQDLSASGQHKYGKNSTEEFSLMVDEGWLVDLSSFKLRQYENGWALLYSDSEHDRLQYDLPIMINTCDRLTNLWPRSGGTQGAIFGGYAVYATASGYVSQTQSDERGEIYIFTGTDQINVTRAISEGKFRILYP